MNLRASDPGPSTASDHHESEYQQRQNLCPDRSSSLVLRLLVVDNGASFGTSLLQPEAENASGTYRSVNVILLILLILRVLFSHQYPGFKLYLCIKMDQLWKPDPSQQNCNVRNLIECVRSELARCSRVRDAASVRRGPFKLHRFRSFNSLPLVVWSWHRLSPVTLA